VAVGRALRILIVLAALSAPTAALAAGSSRVFVTSCTKASAKPSRIDLACDGTNVLTGLKWSSWSSSKARGAGTDALNTCTPDCANGKRHKHAATVTLSKPSKCKGTKHKVFKRIVVAPRGEKPQTFSLGCPVIASHPWY
jgi:hypothetical protein